MVLHVDFTSFAEVVRAELNTTRIYISASAPHTCVAVSDGLAVRSVATASKSEVTESLTDAGFVVIKGELTLPGETPPPMIPHMHVNVVAYKSGSEVPGVWVDASRTEESEVSVLFRMFHELVENGEIPEMEFETFRERIKANFVRLKPEDLEAFLSRQ